MKGLQPTTQLRQARQAAGLELADIERQTRISPSILRWIDEGQYQRLPAGIYARSYVRAFAEAVGLDPGEVLATLQEELPRAEEITFPARTGKREAPFQNRIRDAITASTLPVWAVKLAAAALDAFALVTLSFAVLGMTAAVSGRPIAETVRTGLPALAVVLAVVTMLYFVIFAGIEGRTPGARLMGLPPLDCARPMRLRSVGIRALRIFLSQASLGLELANSRDVRREIRSHDPYGSRSTP
jgi:transcriptional regulator with XRE-family HTH domain